MSVKIIFAALAATSALAVGCIPRAAAGDIQGDAYSCQELWQMRNQIFKSNGYCFRTSRSIAHYGNAGCRFDHEAEVPLTAMDRVILRDIRKSEVRLGC